MSPLEDELDPGIAGAECILRAGRAKADRAIRSPNLPCASSGLGPRAGTHSAWRMTTNLPMSELRRSATSPQPTDLFSNRRDGVLNVAIICPGVSSGQCWSPGQHTLKRTRDRTARTPR